MEIGKPAASLAAAQGIALGDAAEKEKQLGQYGLLNYMISVPSSLTGKAAAKATKDLANEKKD
ncbi:MAG: hypothetical protein ACTHLE_15415 [Agriterribacter sp.]